MTKVILTSVIDFSTKIAQNFYCLRIIDCKLTSDTITSISIFIYLTITCNFNLMNSDTCTLIFCSFIYNCNIIFSVLISYTHSHSIISITTVAQITNSFVFTSWIEILSSSPRTQKPLQQSFLKILTVVYHLDRLRQLCYSWF